MQEISCHKSEQFGSFKPKTDRVSLFNSSLPACHPLAICGRETGYRQHHGFRRPELIVRSTCRSSKTHSIYPEQLFSFGLGICDAAEQAENCRRSTTCISPAPSRLSGPLTFFAGDRKLWSSWLRVDWFSPWRTLASVQPFVQVLQKLSSGCRQPECTITLAVFWLNLLYKSREGTC